MYGIMLVNQAGETVASVGWDNLEGDVTLFGGFVSAIQMFIKRASGGTEINEMKFGDMKLLIGKSKEFHIVTLHGADEATAVSSNRQVCDLVNDSNSGSMTDGVLNLIKELVEVKTEMSKETEESVRNWTQSQMDKAKKAASDWGKTVF